MPGAMATREMVFSCRADILEMAGPMNKIHSTTLIENLFLALQIGKWCLRSLPVFVTTLKFLLGEGYLENGRPYGKRS